MFGDIVKMTHAPAQTRDKAEVLEALGIDLITIADLDIDEIRDGAPNTFAGGSQTMVQYVTEDDALAAAIRVAIWLRRRRLRPHTRSGSPGHAAVGCPARRLRERNRIAAAQISVRSPYISGRRSRKNCHRLRTSRTMSRSRSATTSSSRSSLASARMRPRGSTTYELP